MIARLEADDWKSIRLETCCDILDAMRVPLSSTVRAEMQGGIPYYGANGLLDHINDHIFDEPLILVAEDGGHFSDYQHRTIAYKINGKSWVNNHAHILRPKEGFSFDWIFYQLEHKNIVPFINGSTRDKLNQFDLRSILLPMPESLPEQKAIAGILSKVDEAIEAVENSIKTAERLKKSLMQNLLTGKLKSDGTWRSEDEFYVDEKFGKVPNGWHWGRLSEIADIIAGQSPSGEFYNEVGNGTPMLNGPTEFTDLHPVPVQWTSKVTKLCSVGDILFTVRGSSTGRMNIADQEYCIGRGIAAIRNKEKSDIDFIYYTLITIAEKILAEAKGAGTTFPNVSRGELLKKWILVPETGQTDIASKIKGVELAIKQKQSKVQSLKTLKKSLMQNLLTGKVRVDVEKINKLLEEV